MPSRGLSRCSASRRRLSLCSRGSALLSLACGARTQGVQKEPLATLTWCSLLWSAPRYSLLGSVAAPALASLLLSVLLSLGAIAATPAHPQLGAIAATRSHRYAMGLLFPSLLRRRGGIAATPVAIIAGRAPARRPRGGPPLGLVPLGVRGPPSKVLASLRAAPLLSCLSLLW